MNRFFSALCFVSLTLVGITVQAQNSASTPEVKAVVTAVQKECNLNSNQTAKFTADYVTYANASQKNATMNAGNTQKLNAESQKLLFLLGVKFKGYANNEQFNTLTKMSKEGKLDIKTSSAPTNDKSSANKPSSASKLSATAKTSGSSAASTITSSNVTELFRQLSSFMQVTPEQSAKTIPVLQGYDSKVTDIKTSNAGNASKIQSELSALNSQTTTTLKTILNNQQIGKLAYAMALQENIISGKNLEAGQKALIEKFRTQYNMNDVQLMSVVLIMAQGKIRGDAIKQIAKTNQQAAAKEFGDMMQDLDGQMKSSFTVEQYTNVKADIEKLLKGQ